MVHKPASVYGSQAGSGWGVYGFTPGGIGVNGAATTGTGLWGSSNSGTGVFGTSSTGSAGVFSNTNAANNLPTVAISTNSTNEPALRVTGPNIWGSSIAINNSVSGMEWRMNVQGTTWQVTKVPGSTFTPFRLFQNGNVDFPNTAGTSRVLLLDNGDMGVGTTTPFARLTVVQNNSGVNLGGGANTGSEIKFLGFGTSHISIYNRGNNALTFANTSALAQTDVLGSPLMTLTTAGRLGIGTTTPARNLHVVGNVNITDGTQALNRVLTSDAAGNASWQDPSGIGVVTGSGTLNFVPKWTPNGTNLGNSLLFDDGTRMGIATTTPAYKLDVDATTGGGNGIRVRNTGSFATVDIIGAGNDQALRFGKAGSLYSGINTLPDGDHINFFKFGAGQNLMSLNVNTGNLGVGGNPSAINAVGKVEVRGFNEANNNYTVASGGYQGVTGLVSRDETSAGMPIKIGSYSYADGATSFNFGYNAETGSSAQFNYGAYLRVSSAPPPANTAVSLYASDLVGAVNTYAAWFNGKLRYQDGNQGAGKILVSDAVGDASWSTTSGAGIVGGSGTLNFVPKWTPDGNTLGNSQMFDDGQTTNIGGGALGNRPSTLTLWQSPGTTQASLLFRSPIGELNGIHNEDDGKLYFTANTSDPLTANKIMTIDDGILGVGIGTSNPTTRLNVVQTDATAIFSEVNYTAGVPSIFDDRAANMINSTNSNFGLAAFNNHSNALIPGWKAAVMGIDSSNDIFSSGVAGLYKGNSAGIGVYGASAQNRAFESIATTSALGYVGGHFRGGDAGIHASGGFGTGSSTNKYGVYASAGGGTNAYGIYATANGATNNWAGFFQGSIAVVDGTEGAGRVLTSDASGNASWQDLITPAVGISLADLTVPQSIPSGVGTDVNTWAAALYEDGGANFNPVTGEYTITVTGLYTINGSIGWSSFGAAASEVLTRVLVNGVVVARGFSNQGIVGEYPSTSQATYTTRLNAGDIVKLQAFQNSGSPVTLSSSNRETRFTVTLLRR